MENIVKLRNSPGGFTSKGTVPRSIGFSYRGSRSTAGKGTNLFVKSFGIFLKQDKKFANFESRILGRTSSLWVTSAPIISRFFRNTAFGRFSPRPTKSTHPDPVCPTVWTDWIEKVYPMVKGLAPLDAETAPILSPRGSMEQVEPILSGRVAEQERAFAIDLKRAIQSDN
jgi:hypothetical protein